MSTSHQACFLGAGIATHLGTGIAAQLAGLRQAPQPPVMLACKIGRIHEQVPYKLLADFPLQSIKTRLDTVIDAVITQALDACSLTPAEREAASLFIGSSSFDISVSEHLYAQAQQVHGDAIPLGGSSSFGNLAEAIRRRCGLNGPDFSFNTACTSSANALWYASRMIRAGKIRHALVLGVELMNHITALGFHGLGLLTGSVMKPFDVERDGLVLGEAASALLLGPGDASHYRLLGGANLCDTHSMSAANADGSTIAMVINAALAEAGLPPAAVASIKAHGTASLLNDEAEAAGLLRIFGDAMPPAFALKPYLGHTLGACGLTELILCWQAAADGFLPATPGIGADSTVLGITLTQHHQRPMAGVQLLNYFGFGGNNTALIIGRPGDIGSYREMAR